MQRCKRHFPGSGRSPGVGNSYSLQYSCLENSMERGGWWVTGHGVAKSGIQLSEHHTHTYSHTCTHASIPHTSEWYFLGLLTTVSSHPYLRFHWTPQSLLKFESSLSEPRASDSEPPGLTPGRGPLTPPGLSPHPSGLWAPSQAPSVNPPFHGASNTRCRAAPVSDHPPHSPRPCPSSGPPPTPHRLYSAQNLTWPARLSLLTLTSPGIPGKAACLAHDVAELFWKRREGVREGRTTSATLTGRTPPANHSMSLCGGGHSASHCECVISAHGPLAGIRLFQFF